MQRLFLLIATIALFAIAAQAQTAPATAKPDASYYAVKLSDPPRAPVSVRLPAERVREIQALAEQSALARAEMERRQLIERVKFLEAIIESGIGVNVQNLEVKAQADGSVILTEKPPQPAPPAPLSAQPPKEK